MASYRNNTTQTLGVTTKNGKHASIKAGEVMDNIELADSAANNALLHASALTEERTKSKSEPAK